MRDQGNFRVNNIQQESTYLTDTGVADVYQVTTVLPTTRYTPGLQIHFKAANSNTGSSTLNVSGLGPMLIKKSVNNDLEVGDILAGQIIDVIYDGTNFQLIGGGITTGTVGIVTQDSITVDFSGDGTTLDPLTADVNISQFPDNALLTFLDGLWAPALHTQIVYGGIVLWQSGYTYKVSPAGYYINGLFYTSPETLITLSPADVSFDRIDVIAVNTDGQVVVIEGMPAANPQEPSIDPEFQTKLTIVLVQAGTTQPGGIVQECLYKEHTEWTTLNSASINPDSFNIPFEGFKNIEGTNTTTGQNILLTRPGGAFQPVPTYSTLSFELIPKTNWNNVNRKLVLRWELAGNPVGSVINLINGYAGFDTSNNSTYQLIAIPLSTFGLLSSSTVDSFRITTNTNSPIGYHIDNICIQNSSTPPIGAQGVSGYSGYSGRSGYSGFSGVSISGFSGYSGAGGSGYSGYSGISGYSGLSGYSGYSGIDGAVGSSGYSGFSGVGLSGYSGFSGQDGAAAASGYSGYSGTSTSGYSGFSGQSGYSGFSGAGTSGYSGYSGLSGYSGYSGYSGLSGYSGYSGQSGYSGYSGKSGYSGYSGAAGITSITADNGVLANTSTNVQLGSTVPGEVPFSATRYIATAGHNLQIYDDVGAVPLVVNSLTTSDGIQSFSAGGAGIHAATGNSSTNTILTVVAVERNSDGTPAAGMGGSIDFQLETSDNVNNVVSNRLISKWTNALNSTRTSQFLIRGVNSAVTADLFTLSGSGALQLNKYGVGTFTGTVAKNLQVDSSGNIIETTPASSGATLYYTAVSNTNNSGSNPETLLTITIPANTLTTDGDSIGAHCMASSLTTNSKTLKIRFDDATNNSELSRTTSTAEELHYYFEFVRQDSTHAITSAYIRRSGSIGDSLGIARIVWDYTAQMTIKMIVTAGVANDCIARSLTAQVYKT